MMLNVFQMNKEAGVIKNIVNAIKKLENNCYLIYMSTACVFAGEHEKYYTEEDTPSPKNYYSPMKF